MAIVAADVELGKELDFGLLFDQAGLPYNTLTEVTLLASALRTATVNSADQVNVNARGVLLILNVSAASGTGGLVVRLFAKDPATGNYVQCNSSPAAVTAVGTFGYLVYGGAAGAANFVMSQLSNAPVARIWRAQVAHNDGSNYTYSLAAIPVP